MKTLKSFLNNKDKKIVKIRRIVFGILSIIIILSVILFIKMYKAILYPNVLITNGENISLYISSKDNFENVKEKLYSENIIINKKRFEWLAKKLDYPRYVKSGHYIIADGMNNNKLLNMLRSGSQTPIDLTFNNIRTVEQLAGRMSEQIDADSISIINAIKENATLKEMGFNNESYAALFIPNTYELYWNIDANELIDKMINEYKRFWTEDRLKKSENVGLSPIEVSILASIVDKETVKVSEMSRIAGVYLNRLNKNWLLQADPTLVFAVGDFEIKRVLDVHKEIESPYNTYKYIGLPPGPICIPSIAAIDAVLNAEKHKYLYFCAKDDLSGYHVFARNMTQHNINAEKYRKALNKKKIWK